MKETILNNLKLFGMTNLLIESELDQIERAHAVELRKKVVSKNDENYYPQFEDAIRKEAAIMGEHYAVFYCLERSIRGLINDALEEAEGKNWWTSKRIGDYIKDEVKKNINKEKDSGMTLRSSEPIDYTNFGQLGEIITSNWDIFGSMFNSQKAVQNVMVRLNTLRGPIAHCSLLAEDEILRLQLSLKDWFRLME